MNKNSKIKEQKIYDKNLSLIEEGRKGGQIALMGYDYQLLFSCYQVLHYLDNDIKRLKLEGIEDVDSYKNTLSNDDEIEHIQLKYSKIKQDASFFDSILKNYLEAYLADNKNNKRYFKLVYDLEISKGNLSKLISNDLDSDVRAHWDNKINQIRKDNPAWKWDNFEFDGFIKQLRFEKKTKSTIISEISKLIIEIFDVTSGNENLFISSLFYNVFQKARNRDQISLSDINVIIQDIKDDIAKGYINPAHLWINKIRFDNMISDTHDDDYYEGKKATPKHIANQLPVRREALEKTIIESIEENTITVIKSSSGQGKTTLAWQVAYELNHEYSIYSLKWCADSKEIGNIVEYFNSRLKIGEKILIVLDNLNGELQAWNKLAQELSDKLSIHYKLLITTREEDWYSFGGDQSNLGKLRIIDIYLDIVQAQNIFNKFNDKNKIHKDIDNWQSSWEKVAERKLLIEFVYLITHGEMIEDRIDHQINLMNQVKGANIKLELLRLVAASDVMGLKIKADSLVQYISENSISEYDVDEILTSIENEYFIKFKGNYIEGLHPVRSQYLFDRLHKHTTKSETIKKLIELVEEKDIAQLFSKIPEYSGDNKDDLYMWVVNKVKEKPYSFLYKTLQGVISGSIFRYFYENKKYFDDADKQGGLFLFITEIMPWNNELPILQNLINIDQDNENIKYLFNLSRSIPRMIIKESDLYIYSYYLYNALKDRPSKRVNTDFARLSDWMMKVDTNFNILKQFDLLEDIWEKRYEWDFDEMALLFYQNYLYNREDYLLFVNSHKSQILRFLKIETDTANIYEKDDKIYLNYILLPDDAQNANALSVDRINKICRFLPIYSTYCTKAIQPHIDMLKDFQKGLPDDSFKEMPMQNVAISFNVDLNVLWQKSILSYYEFPSIYHWQKYWFDIRKDIIEFIKMNIDILELRLKNRNVPSEALKSIDTKRIEICNLLIKESIFPNEKRPFEEISILSENTSKMKLGYFSSMRNYLQQFFDIVLLESTENRYNLAIINIKDARDKLPEMHNNFNWICNNSIRYFDTSELENEENLWLDRLVNLNEFYIENIGNKCAYDRQTLKNWIRDSEKKVFDSVQLKIDEMERNSGFKLIKPKYLTKEHNLTTLLIGINQSVIEDESLIRLFYFSTVMLTQGIDFIIYVFITNEGAIFPNGLRVSRFFIEEIKKCIDEDLEYTEDSYVKPIPIEISQDQLNVFEGDFRIEKINKPFYLDDIVKLILQLWKYSQYKDYLDLSNTEENEYCKAILKAVKIETELLLERLNKYIDSDLLVELSKIANHTLEGKNSFSERSLNSWYEKLINLS